MPTKKLVKVENGRQADWAAFKKVWQKEISMFRPLKIV